MSDFHDVTKLDEVVHHPTRLAILATLIEEQRIDWVTLNKDLTVSDANIGSQIQVLAEAGYIEVEKGYENNRHRTWVSITPRGAEAYAQEIESFRMLLKGQEAVAPARSRRGSILRRPREAD